MPARKFGHLECAIRGVRLLIGRRAIITSPMLDKRRGKKWMFSWRAAPGGANYGWNIMEGSLCFNAADKLR